MKHSPQEKPHKSGKVHTLEETQTQNSDEDSDYSWSITDKSGKRACPVFNVTINGVDTEILADSGASVNILSMQDFEKFPKKPDLIPHDNRVYPYGHKKPLEIKGKFVTTISSDKATCSATVIVCEHSSRSLLSWDTSKALKLIDTVNIIDRQQTELPAIKKLKEEYKDIFTGLGKLKDVKIKLHIDRSVPSVVQNHRRSPFHVRKNIEEQLQMDEDRGVIERPTGPTPWVSPIVVVPKKDTGKVRVCVDMRAANIAIKREHHPTPTLTEFVGEMNGAKVFSKIDLNQGYNQLELDEESRYITTFSTHVGLRRYTRLFFGINSAAEVFQDEIRKALTGLKGVINISDDILCFGKDHDEHLKNLKALFARIKERGLTLSKEKCEFGTNRI